MTASLEEKKALILEHETRLANLVAREIINKPELSIWMIVIPIVFVYYFYGLNRYANGKKEFVKNFVFSRSLILDLAFAGIETGEKADFDFLAQKERVPESALDAHREWAKALFEYYMSLLRSEGDNYTDLVKASLKGKSQYLLILNQINGTEKKFYKALRKQLKNSVDDAGEVIGKMEKALEKLRRDDANFVFP